MRRVASAQRAQHEHVDQETEERYIPLNHIVDGQGYATSSQFLKYFVYKDPSFDFLKMDLGPKYDRDRMKTAAVLDAVDPDLTPFRKHGGKLIQYHGWNDPAIPPAGSPRYATEMRAAMGDTSGFYRLYMVPGMLHCRGGAGPGEVEWLDILDRWVTAGEAPKSVVAKAEKSVAQKNVKAAKKDLKAGEKGEKKVSSTRSRLSSARPT